MLMTILNKNADFKEVKDFKEMGAPPKPSLKGRLKKTLTGLMRLG